MNSLNEFLNEFIQSQSKDEKRANGITIVKSTDPDWIKFAKKDGDTGQLFRDKYLKEGFDFKSSVGEMNRSFLEVYYCAILHKKSNQKIKDGVYIVYLLPNDRNEIYLCLAVGVASANGDINVIKNKVEDIRKKVNTSYFDKEFSDSEFTAEVDRAKEYRHSIAYFKKYVKNAIPNNDILEEDLEQMYKIYEQYLSTEEMNMPESKIRYIDVYNQVIFTGAPGTGKTYSIRKYVESKCKNSLTVNGKKINQHKFVQFHPSYDYSDFVEGLRPIEINGKSTFVRVDGIFKEFCRNVVEYNLEKLQIEDIEDLYERCKFKKDADSAAKNEKDRIKNKINETQFYFIIDEINRADLGRVFGELMYGLEEGYRGVENRFSTQYTNLPTYYIDKDDMSKNGYFSESKDGNSDLRDDVFKKGFFIPENVHIIGSMNDIDRSVESFDFALRRRFQWINICANEIMDETLESIFKDNNVEVSSDQRSDLVKSIKAMNYVISSRDGGGQFGINEAYHIGPAYFKDYNPADNTSKQNIWDNRIQPILLEYVRGRKMEKVAPFIRKCAEAFDKDISLSTQYALSSEEDN